MYSQNIMKSINSLTFSIVSIPCAKEHIYLLQLQSLATILRPPYTYVYRPAS